MTNEHKAINCLLTWLEDIKGTKLLLFLDRIGNMDAEPGVNL